ncbi:MAG: hypothetical protein PHG85_02080 [Candidatus Altiarchaeota archaeon]|nr:hypothetical protein [Candidatus Altiarchaeota archaeon]
MTLVKSCPTADAGCLGCQSHFQQLRPNITEVLASKHFLHDAPDFDISLVTDCRHQHFTILHRLEETIQGNHIFRALHNHQHIVYAVDKRHRLIFLRAFDNMKAYERFLDDKKKLVEMIEAA